MKQTFYLLLAVAILIILSSCNSQDGKYIVYKSESRFSVDDLGQQLKKKFAGQEYVLKFTDKYVKMSTPDSKASIVLAKVFIIPNADDYTLSTIEGADSVRVEYQLEVRPDQIKFTVGASRKGHVTMLGNEATVDFYLSKAVN